MPLWSIGLVALALPFRPQEGSGTTGRGSGAAARICAVPVGCCSQRTKRYFLRLASRIYAHGLDVGDLRAQPFAKAQAKTVEREEKYAVTEDADGGEQMLGAADGDDVGQALRLLWPN